jgi:hypothetical protein
MDVPLVEERGVTDSELLRQARETLLASMKNGGQMKSMDVSTALAVWQALREAPEREPRRGESVDGPPAHV